MASSQHLVTVGLHFVEAFNRGDFDGCIEFVHPDVEWYTSNHFYEFERHEGRGEVKAYLKNLSDHVAEGHMEPEDGYQIGDHVMLINRLRGKGTFAHHDISERLNWLVRMEDERFRYVVNYPSPAAARNALEATARGDAAPRAFHSNRR
jgi:ketosteroid isomerase-like protein